MVMTHDCDMYIMVIYFSYVFICIHIYIYIYIIVIDIIYIYTHGDLIQPAGSELWRISIRSYSIAMYQSLPEGMWLSIHRHGQHQY